MGNLVVLSFVPFVRLTIYYLHLLSYLQIFVMFN